MAAFFHGSSEIQDASSDLTLQQQHNLFLMNPHSLPYPTTRFFNPGHALLNSPPPDQLLVGVPTTMDMPTNVHHHHQYYNLCFGSSVDPNPTHNVNPGQGGFHRFEFLPRDTPPGNCKRLSLSLSSQQHQPPPPPATAVTEVPYVTSNEADHMEQGNSPVSSVTNGVVLGVAHSRGVGLFDPKYLKAARELLDEIVSVGDVRNDNVRGSKEKLKMKKEPARGGFSGGGGENGGGDHRAVGGDPSSANKQELQIKKAKLVSMVEEVEQRYKRYRHQMQTIVSSFEHAAGYGSARPYTSVALQTVSKQFRCLKDSLSSQIKIISKSLGEDEGKGGSSRGRLVDRSHHQLRHLGMIQHHHHNNAWRPQRGLPERAVLVLRAWLFEHFLHPYPRDSDKQMLAKQTGLTRSQVSNWFINARVRLWKPMVEEMYLEETKDQPQPTKSQNLNYEASSSNQPSIYALQEHNTNASDQCSSSNIVASGGTLVSRQIKRPRTTLVQTDVVPIQNSSCSLVSFDVAETNTQHVDHTAVTRANVADFNVGFGNYNAAYGNCVSLSLGLPRSCDQRIGNIQFGTSNQIEFSGVSQSSTYENINISDKKRFAAAAAAAAAPLLPEFF